MTLYPKLSRFFLCIAAILIVVFGCSDDKSGNPVPADFVYPLEVGNVWEYFGVMRTFNVQPDSLMDDYGYLIDEESRVEIVKDTTLMDSIEVSTFGERLIQQGTEVDTFYTESYLRNLDDGLHCYGSTGINAKATPLKDNPNKIYFEFKGRKFNSLGEIKDFFTRNIPGISLGYDSVAANPRRCLQYPLKVGEQWAVYDDPDDIVIDKKVIGTATVKIGTRSFSCLKIQWLWDLDNDGEWDEEMEYFDYISTVGLVKRHIIIRDFKITSAESPAPIGSYDFEEKFELEDYSVE